MSGTPGGPPPPQPYSNKRLQQTQAQVDEVVDIMRVNVDKVLERDQKLSELDDRADQLQVQSRQFQTTTTRIRRKYFWQNVKMWIVIIGVVIVILVVIIVWVVSGNKPQNNGDGGGGINPSPSTKPIPGA